MPSDISTYVSTHQTDMFTLLEEMVLIQSGSHNKAGVDKVARLIHRTCEPLPVSIETIEQETLGNHLVIRSHADTAAGGRILLVGHMDTVFPADTGFNWFKREDDRCYGPGVCDMKGGLVAGIFALKALAEAGRLAKIPLTFVCNADEEIGSPSSRALIREQARECAAAFVMECGGPAGEIVTGRKGNLSLQLAVKGLSGHAAFAGPDKASAILDLAHKTVALESLNDPDAGLTVNVGKVSGGIGSNTVAETAQAAVDCRFMTPVQKEAIAAQISAIGHSITVPGTRGTVETVSSRPPMAQTERNKVLYEIVKAAGKNLGQIIGNEYRQGVSDANLIAAEGIPVVDGLGPRGGRDHSTEEYMVSTSLPDRAMLLARAVVAAHRHYAV